jgi:recombinational DNA repair protein RecR
MKRNCEICDQVTDQRLCRACRRYMERRKFMLETIEIMDKVNMEKTGARPLDDVLPMYRR